MLNTFIAQYLYLCIKAFEKHLERKTSEMGIKIQKSPCQLKSKEVPW
jgi:hypothetical protein